MYPKLRVALVAGGVASFVGLGAAAWAHHPFAVMYDAARPITLEGVVEKFVRDPQHSKVYIKSENVGSNGKTQAGATTYWEVEITSTSTLSFRQGFTASALPAGGKITVTGYLPKADTCEVRRNFTTQLSCGMTGRLIVFPNGCKAFVGSTGTGAPRDGADPEEGGTALTCKVS